MNRPSVWRLAATSCALLATAVLNDGAARAATFSYIVNLNGASENAANASPGVGTGTVAYDNVTHMLALHVDFSGLLGTVTASHFHAVTATSGFGGNAAAAAVANVGVATTTPSLAGFPSGVTAGSYTNTLDLTLASSWNPPFVTAQGSLANAESALAGALVAGKTYWNIHTSAFGGGEIRGFPAPVPEPATVALAGVALMGLRKLRRRK